MRDSRPSKSAAPKAFGPHRREKMQKAPRALDRPITLSPEEVSAAKSWVIFEDEHVLVLNKPSGLSSQGGRAQVHTLDEHLWAFSKSNGKRPRLVHRLDRDTSGVILTAKTQPAASFLGKALQAKKFSKTYLALLPHAPQPQHGTVSHPLRRDEEGDEAYMRICALDDEGALASKTLYKTLAAGEEGAIVACTPVTGRMHQIRVHMESLGLPLLGDVRYGGALTAGGRGVPRLMLHARSLTFPHPAGGQMTIEAPVPEDFRAVVQNLGLSFDGL